MTELRTKECPVKANDLKCACYGMSRLARYGYLNAAKNVKLGDGADRGRATSFRWKRAEKVRQVCVSHLSVPFPSAVGCQRRVFT